MRITGIHGHLDIEVTESGHVQVSITEHAGDHIAVVRVTEDGALALATAIEAGALELASRDRAKRRQTS